MPPPLVVDPGSIEPTHRAAQAIASRRAADPATTQAQAFPVPLLPRPSAVDPGSIEATHRAAQAIAARRAADPTTSQEQAFPAPLLPRPSAVDPGRVQRAAAAMAPIESRRASDAGTARAATASFNASGTTTPTVVEVRIGRIEIRAARPAPAQVPAAPPARATTRGDPDSALSDYLQERRQR
jgi:hypothetical protein